jgi:hypothetical protein
VFASLDACVVKADPFLPNAGSALIHRSAGTGTVRLANVVGGAGITVVARGALIKIRFAQPGRHIAEARDARRLIQIAAINRGAGTGAVCLANVISGAEIVVIAGHADVGRVGAGVAESGPMRRVTLALATLRSRREGLVAEVRTVAVALGKRRPATHPGQTHGSEGRARQAAQNPASVDADRDTLREAIEPLSIHRISLRFQQHARSMDHDQAVPGSRPRNPFSGSNETVL